MKQTSFALALLAVLATLWCVGCSFEPSSFAPESAFDSGSESDSGSGPDGGRNSGVSDGGGVDLDATAMPDAQLPDTGNTSPDVGPDSGSDIGPDMPTLARCGNTMVDLQADLLNCGRCGNACDPDFGTCSAGVCTCAAPYTACGDDNLCTDATVDPGNCGTCETLCETGEYCTVGTCDCLPGLTRCDGACVDLENDPRHCGGCGTSCADNSCRNGQCRGNSGCGVLVLECRLDGAGTACVDDLDSPLSCDANLLETCGEVCGGDELCYRPSLLRERRCRRYRPALGCTSCPCSDCDAGESCVELDTLPGTPVCVE